LQPGAARASAVHTASETLGIGGVREIQRIMVGFLTGAGGVAQARDPSRRRDDDGSSMASYGSILRQDRKEKPLLGSIVSCSR
jgi:hypothetical protein